MSIPLVVEIFGGVADDLGVIRGADPFVMTEGVIVEGARVLSVYDAVKGAAVYRVVEGPGDTFNARYPLADLFELEPTIVGIAAVAR